jgi:hypothetical protein
MKIDRTVWYVTLLVLTLAVLPRVEAAEVLNGVKARGQLRCGVSEGIPGFSEHDADGRWRGFDVDFCRAVAAAVLGDPDKVELVPLLASTRFPALQTRRNKHLALWELTPRPPPRMAKSQPLSTEPHIDYSDSQVPPSDNGFYVDPIYPADLLP